MFFAKNNQISVWSPWFYQVFWNHSASMFYTCSKSHNPQNGKMNSDINSNMASNIWNEPFCLEHYCIKHGNILFLSQKIQKTTTIKSRLKCKIVRHGLTQSQQTRRKRTWRLQNLNKVRSIQVTVTDQREVADQ